MESQQIVDYIRQQLAAGHTETKLRQHMLSNGWTGPQITGAFQQYRRATGAKAKLSKKFKLAKARVAKPRRKRTKANSWSFGKGFLVVLVLAIVIVGVYFGRDLFSKKQPATQPAVVPHYTFQQQQAIDVNTVGSAVGEYSVTTGDLPTSTTVGSDGHLVLCGANCDPSVGEVVSLVTYKPDAVKFVAYSPSLTVPSQDTMYVVPAATCENKGTRIDSSNKPKAAVILYGQANTTGLVQRCVIL